MTGWPLPRACLLACWLGELSQQRVPPHCWQVRMCTQRAPIFTHSSHSWRFGCLTSSIDSMCGQVGSFMQHLMYEGDGDRAFADRGGHAFDVAGADVADGEDARQAGLEQIRGACQRPRGQLLVR